MALSINEYLERGAATSKEIQEATGLSQAAVSRQLRKMEGSVVRLRSGRTPRYIKTRNAFGGDDKLPLSIVDPRGDTLLVAHVRPLVTGGFYIEPITGKSSLLLGESGDGLYEDLPYFLLDLAPQGFLGRHIAKEMANQSPDFPSDPRRWNTNHIGRYLVSNGDDLPGNFKFGEQALLRVRRKPEAVSDADYTTLANDVMNGAIPGSSAGGEQPKFTAFSKKSSSHVIVKFSPMGDDKIAERWRDILITEYHAAETIRATIEFPVAETRLIDMDDWLFLESQRFDRTGEHGRMSMVSLASIDAEFAGVGSDWPHVLEELHKKDLISWQHVFQAEFLWCFGKLINNSDMHLGNLSLAIDGNVFRLLPLYDMCSMGFAPKSGGKVPPYSFTPIEPKRINIINEEVFELVKNTVYAFWDRISEDHRISKDFKEFLDKGNPIDMMK